MSEPSSVYSPLDPTRLEIRVIEILSTHPSDAQVRCRLHTISLLDKPIYVALSYVWGDPTITEAIIVDQKEVHVTKNLASALRHVQGHWRGDAQSLRIWADAVCINQMDPKERAIQVSLLMSHVYSLAIEVFGWLGEGGDDDLPLAFQTVQTLCAEFVRPSGIMDSSEIARFNWIQKHDDLITEAKMDNELYSRTWCSVNSLFCHPYWDRVWIVQENCLARKLVLIHGTASLNYDEMVLVVIQLTNLRHTISSEHIERPEFVSQSTFKFFLDVPWATWGSDSHMTRWKLRRKIYHQAKDGHKLLQGMEIFWLMNDIVHTVKATNPKDFVYGCLGMAQPSSTLIIPDYTDEKPVGEVYAELIGSWLRDKNRYRQLDATPENSGVTILSNRESIYKEELFFLSVAGIGAFDNLLNIPSWAPNYPAYAGLHEKRSYIMVRRVAMSLQGYSLPQMHAYSRPVCLRMVLSVSRSRGLLTFLSTQLKETSVYSTILKSYETAVPCTKERCRSSKPFSLFSLWKPR
jgi:hypothetical protein